MSSDAVLASVHGRALETPDKASESVVVPLRAPRAAPMPRQAVAQTAEADCSVVARFTDYARRARPIAPETPPARPRRVARRSPPDLTRTNAAELAWLLREHVESQLGQIAARAPELAPTIETVRRSIDLLLKLPRR